MEKALIAQNRHWNSEKYPNLFSRSLLASITKKMQAKEVHVLLGVRRSGKSTLFKLLINYLLEKADPLAILYVNLDDPFFSEVWRDAKELYRVVETSEKITKKKIKYLLLDEVQNINGWERFVKSAYDADIFKKIFITGSNSSLLKGNYARLLSGRYITDYVYPLSFQEILNAQGIHSYKDLISAKPRVLGILDDILLYGSFPEVFKTEDRDLKREILLNYYETIIFKDCIANHNVRDIKTFKELAFYLISNISSLYSYNSLARAVKSNENTVREFVNILEDSFLMFEVKNFSYSIKTQSRSKKKIYCIDNSFLNTISFKFSDNKGKLLENLVFTEFLKNNFEEVYFYQENKECDFILKQGKKLYAIQVSYEVGASNLEREMEGLRSAMKKLNIQRGYIITYDTEMQLDEKISMVPFWKIYEEFFSILA
jgi:predicted AAA+ superfamily ATPase